MSTSVTPNPAPAPAPSAPNEVTVVSHSSLLYWWPVWATGFLMAGITFVEGTLMTTIPSGTKKAVGMVAVDNKETMAKREYLFAPEESSKSSKESKYDQMSDPDKRGETIAGTRRKALGVIFFTVLLLVIFITNVPLRGMWSILIIIGVFTISLIFALAGWWEIILSYATLLDVRINMGGYLFVSIVLVILWVVTVTFFDRRIYIVFTPGQFRVCTEIGGGERVFDTMGMKLEKQQSDLFRHYVLGLGSGDLIVKTSGATHEHFDLFNVLWINWKIQRIEEMLGKRKVMESR